MSKVIRCQIINTTNNLKCKHKTRNPFLINGRYLCAQHFRYYYGEYYTTYIQKLYRGYKQRRIIHNIYKKLPSDLQRKILYYTREQHYYEKYISTISKIVNPKIFKYLIDIPSEHGMLAVLYNSGYNNINKFLYMIQNLPYLSYIHSIYLKYYCIISIENVELYKKFLQNMRHFNYIFESGYLVNININTETNNSINTNINIYTNIYNYINNIDNFL
jgi:hypothetical protein